MNGLTTSYTPSSIAPTKNMGLMPRTIDEALRLADIMARSNIVPRDYQGNPGNILVAIQWGAELGLPPLQAMQNIAVINGRPAIWGDALLALVRGSGLLEAMTETITATEATCTVTRRGEAETSRTFTLEDAKRAGLAGKSGPWTQYPKRMLQMRARAWALRDVFPDVLRGVHLAEEAQDIPPERAMGPAPVVAEASSASPTGSRTDALKARLASRLQGATEGERVVSDNAEVVPVTPSLTPRLQELGLPVARAQSAIARKFPGRYARAEDIDLDALAEDEGEWVEIQLPRWAKAVQVETPAQVAPPAGAVDGNGNDWGDGFGGEQGVTA